MRPAHSHPLSPSASIESYGQPRRARRRPRRAILTEAAFGQVGAGGSIGFADPECAMSFGYLMNQMGKGILLTDRGQALVDAAYRSLGYRTNAGGSWTK